MIEHHVIGDVDQRRDRPLARGLEAALHPVGRGAVGQPADCSAEEGRTALGILDADRNGARKAALDLRDCQRLQPAHAGCRQVAGDPAHAHAILAIGRDRDIEHRIVEPGIGRERRADRRVARELDDPGMILAKLELACRAHHPAALDPADRRDLQGHVAAGDIGAGRSEHAEHSGARVGRSAHDLNRPLARVDGQHLQLVGLRMLVRGQHARDLERCQRLRRVRQLLDLEPDIGQLLGEVLRRSIGLQMLLEPRQREFHAPTPPDSVGTSSARNP